jgi:hypothetical protein
MPSTATILARLHALVDPPVTFTTGAKVYEPDQVDTSDSAKLKRQLLVTCCETLRSQGTVALDVTATGLASEQAESTLTDDPEGNAFIEIAGLLHLLALKANR